MAQDATQEDPIFLLMSEHLQKYPTNTLKFITQDSYMGINIWTWLIAHPPHVDINLIFNTPQKKQIQHLKISKDLHSTKEGF
jgi:hypothetical protein